MIWWFLILGVSLVVVVSVAMSLYMRVRRQMSSAAALKAEADRLSGGPGSDPDVL
jgi:hypothetical protein